MILQWHITDRCNWRCRHCYQDEYQGKELAFGDMLAVLDDYDFLISKMGLPRQKSIINVTGGEPFIRKDIFRLISELKKRSNKFKWSFLSNGSFINDEIAELLKKSNINNYQVSIEGLEENNDKIRGKGRFKEIIQSIKCLSKAGIWVQVSMTLTQENIKDVRPLIKILKRAGARQLNTRRLVPIGTGSSISLIPPKALKKYYEEGLQLSSLGLRINNGCESAIFHEGYREAGRYTNTCAVTDGRIIVVMPNGDIMPCRRLPIVVGNIKNMSLFEAYYGNDLMQSARDLSNCSDTCKDCANINYCRGGAKCINHAYFGDMFMTDPQCWNAFKVLPEKP